MTDSRSKESFKFGDDNALNVPSDAGERSENIPVAGGASIAERYKRGSLEVHVHVGFGEVEVPDLCAVFKRSRLNPSALDDADIELPSAGASLAPRLADSVGKRPDEAQALVPIYAGKLIENPKPILIWVPTLVRLQLLDSCACLCPDLVDFVHPASEAVPARGLRGGLEESSLVAVDGEVDRSLELSSEFGGPESPNEMIEGTSHVLEGIPDDDAPKLRRLLEHLSVEDVLAEVSIWFMDNSVGFSGGESSKLVAEYVQVLTRPNELEAGTHE